MKNIPLVLFLIVLAPVWGIDPISEDFRFLDQSYTTTATDIQGRQIEETKHFHRSDVYGWISERTITVADGEVLGYERAWWYTDENLNNHFRVSLAPNGNLFVIAMAPVSSGYKGVGTNENENGNLFTIAMNYNAISHGRLRTSQGPLIARGHVNDTMFFRKTWQRADLDGEAFQEKWRSEGTRNFELVEAMKFVEPLLGRWQGTDEQGRPHTNGFFQLSPSWVLEFWRIGEDDDGPRGINIIGTDTLRGGNVSRMSMGRFGFSRFGGRYEEAEPGTVLQFQGNNMLVRKVSGDTMNVTWKGLGGTSYVELRSYDLKKVN